jgi:hypothetical protein
LNRGFTPPAAITAIGTAGDMCGLMDTVIVDDEGIIA